MTPTVLSLDSPGVMAAMADEAGMQRWEVLRRSARPLTVHELAERCGVSDSVAQATLDTLVVAGLAVRVKASARQRQITYRTASERVVIQWDRSNDTHFGFLLQQRRRYRDHSRGIIDRNDDLDARTLQGRVRFRGHQSYMLTPTEAAEVMKALRTAWHQITAIDERARARALREADGPTGNAAQRSGAQTEAEHPYHIALEFRPLKTPDLPWSDLGVWEKQAVERELKYLAHAPASMLTDRELDIARRLAAGGSRPEVAKSLGVTANTIATATKRIYAKLGVRNRAEFTSRMKD
jgi:DNA-binding CsgD family transcriptional regulator